MKRSTLLLGALGVAALGVVLLVATRSDRRPEEADRDSPPGSGSSAAAPARQPSRSVAASEPTTASRPAAPTSPSATRLPPERPAPPRPTPATPPGVAGSSGETPPAAAESPAARAAYFREALGRVRGRIASLEKRLAELRQAASPPPEQIRDLEAQLRAMKYSEPRLEGYVKKAEWEERYGPKR